jgi:hypothetical protein
VVRSGTSVFRVLFPMPGIIPPLSPAFLPNNYFKINQNDVGYLDALVRSIRSGESDGSSPAQTHDGFVLRKPKFDLPLSNEALDPTLQQELLICHLFNNNRDSIADIAHRFSLDVRTIID